MKKNLKPIIIRGAGDIATGTISMLYKAGFPVIATETSNPSSIRRTVSFSESVYEKISSVENIKCTLYDSFEKAYKDSLEGKLPIIVDSNLSLLNKYKPDILIDAILAKKNIGTKKSMAKLVIALGPGFNAGKECDYVIETMRGHTLGKIIEKGEALKNTKTPGIIEGYGKERVIYSSASGTWHIVKDIGMAVKKGDIIANIIGENKIDVLATLDGIVRGSIREGYNVHKGLKVADIDPRKNEINNCYLISDKARCIAGSVLMLVNSFYN